MNTDHVITENGHIVAYVGKDAVALARVKSILSALKLHIKTGGRMRLTRVATPTKMLAWASEYTGKRYKRGQHAQAYEDLLQWALAFETSLPHVAR